MLLTSDIIGQMLPPSNLICISRKMIMDFGVLTGDDNWLHSERAAQDSPFGGIIAQGFLLISIMPKLMKEQLGKDIKTCINVGFNNLRFSEAVREESEVYATATVLDIKNLRGKGYLVTLSVKLRIKGIAKPALTADWNLILG